MAIEGFSKKVMSLGFGFVCAHCLKLLRGFQKGVNHCGYELNGKDCGGPIARPAMAFPHYEGPLTKQTIAEICFKCGGSSDNLIQIPGSNTFVGACDKHVEMVRPNSSKAMIPIDEPKDKRA